MKNGFAFLLFSGLLGCICSLFSSCGNAPEELPTTPYVIVLGIAQDAGFPQASCTKMCCEQVWSGAIDPQFVSCLGLVDPKNNQVWLLDATPDFVAQWNILQRDHSVGLHQPTGIFLTHAHMGHYSGLLHLGREAMGAKNETVFAMPRLDTFLRGNGPWSQLVSLENINIHSLSNRTAIDLTNNLKITPFLVPHRDEFSETVGYQIEGPNKSLVFIPDIDKWEKWETPIEEVIKSVDFALLDGTFYADYELPNRNMSEILHPFITESIKRFSPLPLSEKEKIFFIHLNHTNPLLQPDSEAQIKFQETPFHLAKQGQQFKL